MSAETAWPASVYELGLLAALDERGRNEVERAGELLSLSADTSVYRAGEVGDAFFVVVSGSVALFAVKRGDDAPSLVRRAGRAQLFGEDSALPGGKRLAEAVVDADARLARVPTTVFLRAVERAGGSRNAERELRALSRAATEDLLRTLAFARDLDDKDRLLLLDGTRRLRLERGQMLFEAGDPASAAYLVADGLVQLQSESDGKVGVRAYLGRGDLVGDETALIGEAHSLRAVAVGDSECLEIPAPLLRTLADRNPRLLGRVRRIAEERAERQGEIVAGAAGRTTQHVFHDLYRMQMARSLLAIDQDSCVRCGHCSWACAELYGVTRLLRRGDKIVTRFVGEAEAASLLLPNTCQHCKNPACMPDCPTGAIGRDPSGEVFIRPELCTGCGACARGCPWDNIQMVPRADASRAVRPKGGRRELHTAPAPAPQPVKPGPGTSELLAVKCDLCRSYEAPACVQACPTEAIVRLDPSADFAEVGELLGGAAPGAAGARERRSRGGWLVPAACIAATLLGVAGFLLSRAGVLRASQGVGLLAGWLGLVGCLWLAGYAAVKRRVRAWMRPRGKSRRGAESVRARSRIAPHYRAHLAIGALSAAAVAAHSGLRAGPTLAGALSLSFWALVVVGVFGAVAYAIVPELLARLERRGDLPEDLAGERERLLQRVYQRLSGQHALLKAVFEHVVLPYVRSPFGWLALLLAGHGLRREQAKLRERVERRLAAPQAATGSSDPAPVANDERLAALDEILRLAVELRALPGRRFGTLLLRGFLPLHIVLAAAVLVLIAVHVVGALR